MDINELTISQAKELATMFGNNSGAIHRIDNGMIGKYVIVRCHDAGVHAGILKDYNGRECLLHEARRLWYWKPANNASNLSGVATEGLHPDSKVGAPVNVHLTENCEIIECNSAAEKSIRGIKNHVQ